MDKNESPEAPDEVLNCDICMKEIPAESEEYFETDAYVRHFCGIECYAKWRQANEQKDKN